MKDKYGQKPLLRQDIAYELHEEEGEKLIVLFDPHGYADQPIALPVKLYVLLRLFDGSKSIDDIAQSLSLKSGGSFDRESLYLLVKNLDSLGYMESERLNKQKKEIADYLESNIRPSVLAGSCYPSHKSEFSKYIEQILESAPKNGIEGNAKAIIAPHIDFRIGEEVHKVYSAAYRAIEDSNPDLVVIFGTSHFSNSSLFMLTKKDFETPYGIAETDKDIIDALYENAENSFVIDDMAHKYEHSVELQVALLQKKYENKNFKILPVLTGSLHSYAKGSTTPDKEENFKLFFESLNKIINDRGLNAVYIASADLAHIGRKFGDNFDAEPILPLLKKEDKELIDAAEKLDRNKFFSLIADTNDNRKICGFAPVYALLYAAKASKGKFLDYYQWNERETKSAVSFASLAFWE